MKRMLEKVKGAVLRFWYDERGMGTVEMILIIIVLVGLVIIFKTEITKIVSGLFDKITLQTSKV